MLSLAWPWVLAALPLPAILRYALAALDQPETAALRVPFAAELAAAPPGSERRQHAGWPLWLAALAWLLLLLAASRPQWIGEPLPVAASGRDLLLAVDLSESMDTRDFSLSGRRVSRFAATQAVAGDFIRRRQGDRVGLILFASSAYLQAPLTFDRVTVDALLQEAFIGLAGRETAIGDAIGLAVKRLRERPAENRVLVLLTDGANTAGQVAPLKAAELAADHGVRVYTLGIGRRAGPGLFGSRGNSLDEATLRRIAERTGGAYFSAAETEELERIYADLDRLEPIEQDPRWLRPRTSLYPWPLGAALLLAAALLLGRRLAERSLA